MTACGGKRDMFCHLELELIECNTIKKEKQVVSLSMDALYWGPAYTGHPFLLLFLDLKYFHTLCFLECTI